MSAVLNFHQLLELNKKTFYRDLIDLSDLLEEFQTFAPVRLRLSNTEHSSSDMRNAVVMNLCKNPANKTYPMYGLRAVGNIISKDLTEDDTKIQLIILVHALKMALSNESSACFCLMFDRMTSNVEINDWVRSWEDISRKTVKNAHIRDLINESMMDVFGSQYAAKISETNDVDVNVIFIGSDTSLPDFSKLRGFCGFNTVYINKNHFDEKRRNGSADDLILIDVVSTVIHELSHVRIRQVLDDLNMSTPSLAIGTQETDLEFGRIVERKLFGLAVNWIGSSIVGKVPSAYVDSFIKSIRLNGTPPVVPADAIFYPRPNPVSFHSGADMDDLGQFIE